MLDARIQSQGDVEGSVARASQLVKRSREHSRDAKLLGLVHLADFVIFGEELGGPEDIHALSGRNQSIGDKNVQPDGAHICRRLSTIT